jgi:hypothetical protein
MNWLKRTVIGNKSAALGEKVTQVFQHALKVADEANSHKQAMTVVIAHAGQEVEAADRALQTLNNALRAAD